jgi:hypothetical protein
MNRDNLPVTAIVEALEVERQAKRDQAYVRAFAFGEPNAR